MTETQSAGATPAVPGATPGQNDTTAAATGTPATGDGDMATDAGKRALDQLRAELRAERAAAKTAAAELEAFRAGQLTEHEKAISQAVKAAQAEARGRADAMVRKAEVRRALASSGILTDSLDLAAAAREFSDLAVDDDGNVADLDRAVAEFRKARPALFVKQAAAAGNFDGGPSGSGSGPTVYTADQIGDRAFYEKHRDDIMAAFREGRIVAG